MQKFVNFMFLTEQPDLGYDSIFHWHKKVINNSIYAYRILVNLIVQLTRFAEDRLKFFKLKKTTNKLDR